MALKLGFVSSMGSESILSSEQMSLATCLRHVVLAMCLLTSLPRQTFSFSLQFENKELFLNRANVLMHLKKNQPKTIITVELMQSAQSCKCASPH